MKKSNKRNAARAPARGGHGALAGFRRFLAKIYTPLRYVSKFFNARALESGNALRNVRIKNAKIRNIGGLAVPAGGYSQIGII